MQRQPENLTLRAVKENFFKNSLTFVKDGKADFIQEQWGRYRDYCNGILQYGRETEFNSKYSMGKRECITKKQGAGVSG